MSVVIRNNPILYARIMHENLWRDVYNVISDRIHGNLSNIHKRTNEINYIINELSKIDVYKNILTSDDVEICTGVCLEFNRNHRDKIVMSIRTETIDVWIEYDYVD